MQCLFLTFDLNANACYSESSFWCSSSYCRYGWKRAATVSILLFKCLYLVTMPILPEPLQDMLLRLLGRGQKVLKANWRSNTTRQVFVIPTPGLGSMFANARLVVDTSGSRSTCSKSGQTGYGREAYQRKCPGSSCYQRERFPCFDWRRNSALAWYPLEIEVSKSLCMLHRSFFQMHHQQPSNSCAPAQIYPML